MNRWTPFFNSLFEGSENYKKDYQNVQMKIIRSNYLIIFLAVLLTFSVLQSFVTNNSSLGYNTNSTSKDLNIALRQIGDELYRMCGDHSSQIPPVTTISDHEVSLRLDRGVEYSFLPAVVRSTMASFDIQEKYVVSLTDCEDDEILLGYLSTDDKSTNIPCQGRHQTNICSVINLRVLPAKKTESSLPNFPFYLILFVLLGVIIARVLIDRNGKAALHKPISNAKDLVKESDYNPAVDTVVHSAISDMAVLIGRSEYDRQKMTYTYDQQTKKLTFREAKLFDFLISHPNEILKRDDIQNHVWEEEGVIVGRSLDVFISRLRKIIKQDHTLSIKNIHGVGYRLEVQ